MPARREGAGRQSSRKDRGGSQPRKQQQQAKKGEAKEKEAMCAPPAAGGTNFLLGEDSLDAVSSAREPAASPSMPGNISAP